MTKYYMLEGMSHLSICFAGIDNNILYMRGDMIFKTEGQVVINALQPSKIVHMSEVHHSFKKMKGSIVFVHKKDLLKLIEEKDSNALYWIDDSGSRRSVNIPADNKLTDDKAIQFLRYSLIDDPSVRFWFYKIIRGAEMELSSISGGKDKDFVNWYNAINKKSEGDSKIYIEDSFSKIIYEHESIKRRFENGV